MKKIILVQKTQAGPSTVTSTHKCPHPGCSKTFERSVQLGGHMSKCHSGTSASFNHKMEVRKAREKDRDNLAKAKTWYMEQFGDLHVSRQVFTRIKEVLLSG